MEEMVIFDWMHINDVFAHVEINRKTGHVLCQEYSNELPFMFLGKCPHEIRYVMMRFKGRCFEEGRPDKKEILESMGLNQYSPFDIVKFTHGHTDRDDCWIRFQGENLEYFRDINILRPSKEERL